MRTLHAEWTKLRTVPSTAWLLLAIVVLTTGLAWAVSGSLNFRECEPPECYLDTTKLSLMGVWLGQVAVVILAVLMVSNEYASRMITTTLVADPRRLRVLASKLTLATVVTLAAGALGVGGSLLVARSLLPGNGFTPAHGYASLSLADDLTRRAAAGSVLYLGLIAVLAAGVAVIVRDTAGAVTTVLGLLFGGPLISAFLTDPHWQHRLQRYAPMQAGLAIQSTRDLAKLAIGPWAGLGLLSAYAGAAVVIAALLFRFRDA
jgi:ABC-2 type transport system permease protein